MILNLELGFHENVKEQDYHKDNLCAVPTLSRSLAKILLDQAPIHCFHAHPRLSPVAADAGEEDEDATPTMDFGSLGHKLLLGKGAEIVVGEWKAWQSNAAKDFRKAARAAGQLPVLRKTYERGIALKFGALEELRRLGLRESFLEAKPEVVCIFEEAGVRLRCMFDRVDIENGIIYDIKITDSAHPKACERQIQNMKYDLQDVFYRTGFELTKRELSGRSRFIMLFIENSFPFLVTPMECDGAFRTNGVAKYSHAFAVWQKCNLLNQWPGYVTGVTKASPKDWALAEEIGRQMPKFQE